MIAETIVLPGVRERAVRFGPADAPLAGVLSLPEGVPARERGLVALHGWGTYRDGPHEMLCKLARDLAARGTPVLRFDFRGRGESPGAYGETDLDAMIDDAILAASFLKQATGVRDAAAVGLCSGANVALAAAAWGGAFDRVASLSVLPFQSHKSAMQSLRRTRGMLRGLAAKAFRLSTWRRLFTGEVRILRVLRGLVGGEGGKARTPAGQTRNLKDSSRDLMGALARFRGKVLFVWGGADAEGAGARAHFEEFARASGLEAEFRTVEGSNHNFYSLEWERQVFDLVRGFVERA